MRVSIILNGDEAAIRILIKHPMETGMRKDKLSGKLIPAHFIKSLVVDHNGQRVIDAKCGVAISRNPFFFFKIQGVASGDSIKLAWLDNKGVSEEKQEMVA